MADWLPSQRSNDANDANSANDANATDRTTPNAGAGGGVATQERTDGRRQRFTETVTARARAVTAGTGRQPSTRPTRRLVRRDIMVRRVDPWSVLKISVVFYSCMLIIAMLANAVFWAFVTRLGLIDQATEIAGALNIALTVNTGNILRAFFLVGILGVIFGSAVNVFFAFLYNLVADLIGGIRVDLAEDE
jgi:hypothetical protein